MPIAIKHSGKQSSGHYRGSAKQKNSRLVFEEGRVKHGPAMTSCAVLVAAGQRVFESD